MESKMGRIKKNILMMILFHAKMQRIRKEIQKMFCVFQNFAPLREITCLIFFSITISSHAQQQLWHGTEREIRYHPEGNDIVIENGNKRFNRALYGANTAFRAEAGDLPEFALYMPGMGGNLQFGIIAGNQTKWLIQADHIKTIYRAGSMLYEIKDPLLKNGIIYLTAIASYETEGLIIQLRSKNIPAGVELVTVYGGATGKRFSRDGDIGADPESSFYLKPEYCTDNIYKINKNSFSLLYGFSKALTEEERYEIQHFPSVSKENNKTTDAKRIAGFFPAGMNIKIADANKLQSPLSVWQADSSSAPVIVAKKNLKVTDELFFFIGKDDKANPKEHDSVKKYFANAEDARKQIAERIKINTPDAYINTLGPVLSIAADAIWESPSYMHGAVAWRMRLNGWRGAYAADVLGWHDRARQHFNGYANSQLTAPPVTGVVTDTALHLARHQEKIGTALFSDGYIARNPNDSSRAHHYDMNLVFIDQLLNHFNWTGDTAYVKQMWPLLKRHLAWEKRNFDADGDGLYDAYAAIWASDALQYSGGGVTHSSAYNYRANKMAAELARIIGEDGTIYKNEADKIHAAIQKNLWLPEQGSYAEYNDLLGKQLIHPSPGLWTIYHAIDSKVPDPFQAYLNLRYIDSHIPHIPIKAKGLEDTTLYTLSTTNWQPYTWSLNNVALAENLHTALAYWQGGRNEEAYKIWKGNLIESMYLGSSPGNIQQLSFYDAIRGELYRDFADPIGMAARSLVEGLFGIQPDALHDTLTIQPGFPNEWNYASLETPDINVDLKRNGNTDTYLIKQFFKKNLSLKLLVHASKDNIESIRINGIKTQYQLMFSAVGSPLVIINVPASNQYNIVIKWKGNAIIKTKFAYQIDNTKDFQLSWPGVTMLSTYDETGVMNYAKLRNNKLYIKAGDMTSWNKMFIRIKQGLFTWWQPVFIYPHFNLDLSFFDSSFNYIVTIEEKPADKLDLSKYFNDKVTNIFKHQYLSPRPGSPTLQLPTQGIGNWAYPLATANIDDSGVRKLAAADNEITYSGEISFATPADTLLNNIVFTSQWDNFPDSVIIPLSGNASQIYLLMAGSTNPMQSHVTNGMVVVSYDDNTADTLLLKNPDNWWPIEQDYYIDGFAFNACCELPDRLYLKEGRFAKELSSYTSIRGFSNKAIDGGAATVLSMFLNKGKELRSLTVYAIANDVVIGLMAATLVKD